MERVMEFKTIGGYTMADFIPEFNHVVGEEGNYTNDPNDRGGETIFGITIADARAYGYNGPMAEMPLSIAQSIYKKNYWDALNLDAVTNQAIAGRLFDDAVNQGVPTAARFLQEGLNLLNRNGDSWPQIAEDGIIGPATLGILNDLSAVDGAYLLKTLNGLQFSRYVSIILGDATQKKFFRGWINRLA